MKGKKASFWKQVQILNKEYCERIKVEGESIAKTLTQPTTGCRLVGGKITCF